MSAYSGAAGLYIGSSRLNQSGPRGDVPLSFCAASAPAADGSTSSIAYGSVVIDRSSPCFCDATAGGACTYFASVGGDTFASFSIVVTQGQQGTVQLLDGLATRALGVAGGSALYDFVFVPSAVAGTGPVATFTLSQIGGERDAVVYARMHRDGDMTMVPAAATAHFTATVVAGTAVLTIPRNAPVFLEACRPINGTLSSSPCRVHISVFTPVAALYSIQARTDIGQQLFDAIPVTGDAAVGQVSYFRFQHSQPLSPLVITVTAGTGPVEVYVSNNGQQAQGMWPPGPGAGKSGWRFVPVNPTTEMPVQTITVFPTDAGACTAPCTYAVGVLPSAALNDQTARVTFSVMARTRDVSTVQLLDGRPTTDIVSSAGAYNYYSIVLPPTSASLTVQLSALTGTVAAFGTFEPGALPSPEAAARGGFSTGSDRVGGGDTTFLVSRFDTRVSRWCNINNTRFEPRQDTQTIFITEFRNVTQEEQMTVPATWTDPETGEVYTGPQVIVRNVTRLRPFSIPVVQNITVMQPVFDITPLTCTLQIGVVSDQTGSGYALTAATRARLLPDSLPLRLEVAAGETQFLAYEAAAGALRTTISLTNILGRVAVFVSTVNPTPNASTAQYVVGGSGASAVTLDASALGLCDPSAVRCVYYLAVQAQGPSAAIAQLQGSSFRVTPVRIGEQVPGRVGPSVGGGSPAYYTFTAPSTGTELEITVEPLSGGWAHLMMGGVVDPATGVVIQPTAVCNTPGSGVFALATCDPLDLQVSNAGYAVQGLFSRTRLRVSAGDGADRYAPGRVYVLAVTSSLDTEFILTIRQVAAPAVDVVLPSGVMLHDTLLSSDQIFYYSVAVPLSRLSGSDPLTVRVQLTPVQSDVVMYLGVGGNRRPTRANAVASAGFVEGYRFSLEPAFLLPLCSGLMGSPVCQVTFGVQAASTAPTPAVFGIIASIGREDSSSVQLSNGLPQLGSVARGAFSYYHVPLAGFPADVPLFVSIVEVNDGFADLFVGVDGQVPSNTRFALTSTGIVAPEIVTLLPGTELYARARASGRLTVAIFGNPTSPADLAEFFIQVGTQAGVTELSDGSTVEGSVQPGGVTYYALTVPGGMSDLEASITPLSGSPVLTASVWYRAGDASFNPALRPAATAGSFTWRANFENTLFVPSMDNNACHTTGQCTYIYAVTCQGRITCQFEMSATTNMFVPVRMALGVPQLGYLLQGMTRYYIFDGGVDAKDFTVSAQTTTGDVQLFVSDSWVPGTSDVNTLPTILNAATYRYSSPEGQPFLTFSQSALVTTLPVGGPVPLRAERIYVVGVYASRGPTSFTLLARQNNGAIVLGPGMTSALMPLPWKQSVTFTYDNQDPSSDLLVSLTMLYGFVTVTANSNARVATCTVDGRGVTSGPNARASVNCTGGIWQAASVEGSSSVQLRISGSRPCVSTGGTIILPGTCVPSADWQASLVTVTVTATDDSLFQIVATTGQDAVRAYDGTPLALTQAQGDRPTVVLFQMTPDGQQGELHLTLAASSSAASADYYITSCVSSACTVAEQLPGPNFSRASGQIQSGARQEIVIRPGSPAYCNGTTADICNYYLVLSPSATFCRIARLSPCVARVDATFFSNTGSAPIIVDFNTLFQRITTMSNVLRQPEIIGADPKYTHYNFFINRPGAPDDDTMDVVVRLDACDSLRGSPSAFLCVSTPGPDRQQCLNRRRPRPGDGNNNMMLTTAASGIDRAFLLSEPSNELFVAVTLNPHREGRVVASDAALRRFGPSTFELQIIDGPAVRMRLPFAGDGVLAAPTFVRVAPTVARLSWDPVVMTADNAPFSDNTTSTGVTYRVYWAPESFTSFASSITGASAADLGIVASTPCGLERWSAMLNDNTQPIIVPPGPTGTGNTQTLLTGLQPGKRYRVAVVAVCDDDCLSANHLAMGLNRPDGPLSTQRLSYGLADVRVVDVPTPSPSPKAAGGGDGHGGSGSSDGPIDGTTYGLGVLVALGFVGYVLFVAFRKRATEEKILAPKPLEEGEVEAVVNAGSEEAVLVTVNPSSHFMSSRKLVNTGAGSSGAGADPAASATGGRAVGPTGTVQPNAELQALQRITQRVFSSPQAASSSTAGATAPADDSSTLLPKA